MSLLYYTHTLTNGLRIIHCHTNSQVAYCGLAVNAGSRDEEQGYFGLAHFVEHTIFKGTKNRRSWHILNRMERVGGELNAYTSKEETILYSIYPAQYYDRAIELLSDLVSNSIFPASEIGKEKEVIIDEINSYRDNPAEAVYDDFEDLIFNNEQLGHNILGTKEDLDNMNPDVCRDYLDRLYVPSNMVFFSMGNISPEKLFKMADKYFGALHHGLSRPKRIKPEILPVFHTRTHIDSYQSHTMVGCQIPGMFDKNKYPLLLLNNILGGPGMNSMLNVSMRERKGYVYTVESSISLYTDCGLFSIYFGSDPHHVKPCLRIIDRHLNELAEKPISENILNAAKKQYIGQLLISTENREGSAIASGKSMLYFNKLSSTEEITEQIMSVTPQVIQDIAASIGPNNCSILTME